VDLNFYNMREDDFTPLLGLSDWVNGEGVFDYPTLEYVFRTSCDRGLCCSYVVYDGLREQKEMVGFRLTQAAGMWEPTKYHSPEKWKVDPTKVCRFNAVAVHPNYRRLGIGRQLMERSVETAKQLGAEAGVTHVWLQSPNNGALEYWTRLGGELIHIWPGKWHEEYKERGVTCGADGKDCNCDGAEMILYFGEAR
jgi:GNAT superfamily N-acetyltransferase